MLGLFSDLKSALLSALAGALGLAVAGTWLWAVLIVGPRHDALGYARARAEDAAAIEAKNRMIETMNAHAAEQFDALDKDIARAKAEAGQVTIVPLPVTVRSPCDLPEPVRSSLSRIGRARP